MLGITRQPFKEMATPSTSSIRSPDLRILYIHEVNYLTKPIFEMHEFPEQLAARGHEVAFLHFAEGFKQAEVLHLGFERSLFGRAFPDSTLALYTPQVTGVGLAGRLISAVLGGHSIVKAIRAFRPDTIVTLAVPTFGWQAVLIARHMKIPVVYRALDVSHRIRRGPWSPLVRVAERFVISKVDWVSANNPIMAKYCESMGANADRVVTHFPPIQVESFHEGSREKGLDRLGINDGEQLIMYMGSFFYFSGLADVVEEFARLNPKGTVKLVLVGGGELDSSLRNSVKDLGLVSRVLFTGFVDADDLPGLLKAADVLINPMLKSTVSDTALPNKMIQYLASGPPVVSTSLEGLRDTFSRFEGIYWAESPKETIATALALLGKAELPKNSKNHEKLNLYFGPASLDSFEEFLESVVGSK